MDKIKATVKSISFWMSVIGGVVLVLAQYDILPMEVATIIAGWCGFGIVKRQASKSLPTLRS